MLKTLQKILGLACVVAIPTLAHAQVDGKCGSASGVAPDSVLAATDDTLCDAGIAINFSATSGSGPWTWSCATGSYTDGCYAPATTANTCLPFTMPSRDMLYDQGNNGRQVFALYFGDYYNISLDNLTPAAGYSNTDSYNSVWLNPTDWALNDQVYNNGFAMLRARPLPVAPGPNSLYRMMNFARSVRMALARGITGFVYEVSDFSCSPIGYGCVQTLNELLAAAQSVDPRFKIVLAPDAAIAGPATQQTPDFGPQTFMNIVAAVYDNPGLYRYNNMVVVAPWWIGAPTNVNWVTDIKQPLAASGHPIFFMPIDISGSNWPTQQPASDGFSLFATASPLESAANNNDGPALWNLSPHIPYMAGVTPQHYRPQAYSYWEPMDTNGLGFIDGWQSVITPATPNPPPWVLIATWNDFSENTPIEPYTDASLSGSVGTGFYNLNGYFASWYLTGSQPTITHDMLYYFYKREPVGAIPTAPCALGSGTTSINGTCQATGTPAPILVHDSSSAPGVDLIEVVAFLMQPGNTITVTVNGQSYSNTTPLGAGLQVFNVPLPSGLTTPTNPTFSLSRGGQLFQITGQTPIGASLPAGYLGYTDLTYWSGGGSADGVCNLAVPPESLTGTVDNAGLCGPASSAPAVLAIAPTSGLCASGATASAVIGTGPFIWSCSGSGTNSNNTSVCAAK